MSEIGDDFGFTGVTPEQTWGVDPIETVPEPPPVDFGGSGFGSGGWTENDWGNLIGTIGKTFASTFNAVNNPGAPSAYSSPQENPGAQPGDYGQPQTSQASF